MIGRLLPALQNRLCERRTRRTHLAAAWHRAAFSGRKPLKHDRDKIGRGAPERERERERESKEGDAAVQPLHLLLERENWSELVAFLASRR